MYIPGTNSMIWPEICWITLRDIEKCATLRRNKCIERPTALISQRCHRPAPWETNLLRLNQTFNFVARDYKMQFMDFLVVPRKRLENRRWKKRMKWGARKICKNKWNSERYTQEVSFNYSLLLAFVVLAMVFFFSRWFPQSTRECLMASSGLQCGEIFLWHKTRQVPMQSRLKTQSMLRVQGHSPVRIPAHSHLWLSCLVLVDCFTRSVALTHPIARSFTCSQVHEDRVYVLNWINASIS